MLSRMAELFEPWTRYPSLTAERLSVVGYILRQTRHDTANLHEVENGDNEWSLGCRAYARSCFALQAATTQFSWLSILPEFERLRFTFAIGSIPIRFYRGLPDDPPARYLVASYAELHQQQLALTIDGLPILPKTLRIAVETGAMHEVSNVILVELEEDGTPIAQYTILASVGISNIVPMQAEPITLPAPTLEPINNETQAEQAENDDAADVG
jgi:hypothetical protein